MSSAIIGYSEMLMEEAEDLGQQALTPDLRKIQGAGKHLLALINDILDLSKIEAGRTTLYLETFEVGKLIEEVTSTVRPLIDQNANRLEVACPAEIGSMRADMTKVRQALFNLLSNAGKFTENGLIRLEVRRTGTPPLMLFTVTDTGIGMTGEQMSRLFQAFSQADASTTRKYGGTGLGLAISRRFCQLMQGDLTATSQPGRGSAFTIRLPCEVPETAGPAPTPATPPPLPQPAELIPRVLVIDDEASALELMQRHLSRAGFQVACATDGPRGIEMARRLNPAVITLDVVMPTMDGWAVLKALKEDPATAHIPVILLTNLDDKNLGYALGAADYQTKPVDFQRLAGLLRKLTRPTPSPAR